MKNISLKVIILAISTNICCSQEKSTRQLHNNEVLTITVQEDGKIENSIYKCNLFDWQISIPEGYTIRSQERTKELEDKGLSAIKENLPAGQREIPRAKTLISFENGIYNSFGATYEPIPKTQIMTLEEHQSFIAKLLQDTYNSTGMKVEIVKSNLKIGKRDFYKLLIKLYNPKNDSLLLIQEFYVTYLNSHVFTAAISYQNEEAGMVLNYCFLKSFK
jgi:hypothetical protein